MKPESFANLYRLQAGGEAFLCAREPEIDPALQARLAERIEALPGAPPALLYWDARVEGEGADAIVRFGHGGLDPLIASEHDLSGCVAISERAYQSLSTHGAVTGDGDFARAIALLARSPGVSSLWCEGVVGVIDLMTPSPMKQGQPVARADAVSVAVLVPRPDISVAPFFAALRGQAISGQIDLLVITHGFDSNALRSLAHELEIAAASDQRLSVRRYSLVGGLDAAYLANMAVGLATAEVVVLADARCVPVTPGTVDRLANAAISSDISAACPRILHKGQLVSAGMALIRKGQDDLLTLWTDPLLGERQRTAAAPAPWFFAVRRAAWLAANGIRAVSGAALWSAEFAGGRGPRGRTVLLGAELAEWIGQERPVPSGASIPAPVRLQATAAVAVRDPRAMDSTVVSPATAGAASDRALGAFSDPFNRGAEERLLIFADAFGASQQIAFVDGLAAARAAGKIAVRIVEEKAFGDDSRALDQGEAGTLVDRHIEQTQPTVIVASRLGHAAVWKALRAAASRIGAPVVFHIDDDIPGLPVTLGIERYRMASGARRRQAMAEGLAQADLVLTTTPALADRLRPAAGHGRFAALSAGTAGRPAVRGPAPSREGEVVVGYMGSASHDHDLAMIVPALNRMGADYGALRLVLFGSIAEQPAAQRLEGTVERIPPTADYTAFRRTLASLRLDIGLAPLVDTAFNRVKTPTKWVEYAEAGAAVVASPVGPYLPLIREQVVLPAQDAGWEPALRRLIEDSALRRSLVSRSNTVLTERFGWERLEAEMIAVLNSVRAAARRAA